MAHGNSPSQIGQAEGRLPVSSIRGAQQGKQCSVLGNGDKLAVAKRPAVGGKGASEHSYFTDKGLGHGFPL
jgi:hypothetical protein